MSDSERNAYDGAYAACRPLRRNAFATIRAATGANRRRRRRIPRSCVASARLVRRARAIATIFLTDDRSSPHVAWTEACGYGCASARLGRSGCVGSLESRRNRHRARCSGRWRRVPPGPVHRGPAVGVVRPPACSRRCACGDGVAARSPTSSHPDAPQSPVLCSRCAAFRAPQAGAVRAGSLRPARIQHRGRAPRVGQAQQAVGDAG